MRRRPQRRWLAVGIGLVGLLVGGAVPGGAQGGEGGGTEGIIPERTAYVVDRAQVLGDEVEAGLNRALARVEAEHGAQIYVLTVPLTEPLPLKEYIRRVWESWGLNKEDPQLKTLIFLVAVEDGQVMLSTSRGLQDLLPDGTLAEILQRTILPAFERGAFERGIVTGIQEMIRALAQKRGEAEEAVGARPFQERRLSTVDLLGILLALAVVAAIVWWINASA